MSTEGQHWADVTGFGLWDSSESFRSWGSDGYQTSESVGHESLALKERREKTPVRLKFVQTGEVWSPQMVS